MKFLVRLKYYFRRIKHEHLNQKILKKNPNAAVVNYEILKKKKMNRS